MKKKFWSVAITAIFLLNTVSYPAYGMRKLMPASRYDGVGPEDRKHAKQVERLAGKAEQGREDLEVSNLLRSKRFIELFGNDKVEIRRLLRKISSAEGPFGAEKIKKVLEGEEYKTLGINAEEIEGLARLITVAIMGTVPIEMAKQILAGKRPAISLTDVGVTVSDKFVEAVDDLLSSVYIEERYDKPASWLLIFIYNSIANDDDKEAKRKLSYLLRRAYNMQRIERAKSIFNPNTLATIETLGELKGDFGKTLEKMKRLFAEAERDASQYYAMQAQALLLEDAAEDAGANLSPIDVPDGFKSMVQRTLSLKDGSKEAKEFAENTVLFLLSALVQGEEKGERFARYLFRQVRLLREQGNPRWTAEDVIRRIENIVEGNTYRLRVKNRKGFPSKYISHTEYDLDGIIRRFVKNRGLDRDLDLEEMQGIASRRLLAEAREIFKKAEKSSFLYLARAINFEPIIGVSQFDLLSMFKSEHTGPHKILITASTFYNKEGKPKPFITNFLDKLTFLLPYEKEFIVVAPRDDKELIKKIEKSLECEVIGPLEAKEEIMHEKTAALVDAGFLERKDLSEEEKEWVVETKKKFPQYVITIGKIREDQRSLDLLAAFYPFVRDESKEKFLAILADTCLINGITQEQTARMVDKARMETFNWVITPSDIKLASYREAEQEYWADREPIEGMK